MFSFWETGTLWAEVFWHSFSCYFFFLKGVPQGPSVSDNLVGVFVYNSIWGEDDDEGNEGNSTGSGWNGGDLNVSIQIWGAAKRSTHSTPHQDSGWLGHMGSDMITSNIGIISLAILRTPKFDQPIISRGMSLLGELLLPYVFF